MTDKKSRVRLSMIRQMQGEPTKGVIRRTTITGCLADIECYFKLPKDFLKEFHEDQRITITISNEPEPTERERGVK